MDTRRQAAALSDPASTFLEPRFVAENKGLTREEKIKVLLDWRQDLLELQTASDENMSRKRGDSNVGARLTAVTDALIALGYESA